MKKTPDYDNVFKTMKMKHKRVQEELSNECESRDFTLRGVSD